MPVDWMAVSVRLMVRRPSPFCVDLKISHASESDVGVENVIQSMVGNGMIFAW